MANATDEAEMNIQALLRGRRVLRTRRSKIISEARLRLEEEKKGAEIPIDDITELIDRLRDVEADLRQADKEIRPLVADDRADEEYAKADEILDEISSLMSRLRSASN